MNQFRTWHRLRGHRIEKVGYTGMFAAPVRECSCGDGWVDHLSMAGVSIQYIPAESGSTTTENEE